MKHLCNELFFGHGWHTFYCDSEFTIRYRKNGKLNRHTWELYKIDRGAYIKKVDWNNINKRSQYFIVESIPFYIHDFPWKLDEEYYKELSTLERDEQNSIFGYKCLIFNKQHGLFQSPIQFDLWFGEKIQVYSEMNKENDYGIHAMKSRSNPTLQLYLMDDELFSPRKLVRICMSGKIIEGEFGLRSEKARIVEIIK